MSSDSGVYVAYTDQFIEVRACISPYSLTAGSTDESLSLPSNVKTTEDIYFTACGLDAAWQPVAVIYGVIKSSSNGIKIRTSEDISGGVLMINNTFSRERFTIS